MKNGKDMPHATNPFLPRALTSSSAAERRALEKLYAVLNLKAIRQATAESTKDLELAYASTNDAKKIYNKIFGR